MNTALTYERALERTSRDLAWRAHSNYLGGANNQWEGVNISTVALTLSMVYGLPTTKVYEALETATFDLYYGPEFLNQKRP